MRECAHDPGATGQCLSFKSYNSSSYNKNTLFYNPKNNSMQPCLGGVSAFGKCTAYGIVNHSKVTANKGQLFYDPKNKKMTTCRFVTVTGTCSHYDLVPNTYASNSGGWKTMSGDDGGWKMTPDPSNPYYKRVPRTSKQLLDLSRRLISGSCTLGLNF